MGMSTLCDYSKKPVVHANIFSVMSHQQNAEVLYHTMVFVRTVYALANQVNTMEKK